MSGKGPVKAFVVCFVHFVITLWGFGRQKGVAWLVAYTIPTYYSSQYTLFALRMNTLVLDYLTRLCVKLDCCFPLVLSSSTHV